METSLFNRLQATLLAVATAGLVLLAVLNFRQESQFQQPDDGVWWMEAANGSGLEATKVLPNSPAERAGIHPHDLLTGVNGDPVVHLSDLNRELYRTGIYTKAEYSITRDGIQLDEPVVVIPVPPDRSVQLALAADRADLSGHRPLCSLPPLDRAPRDAFLSLLPGLVRAQCAEVHRRAGTRWTRSSSGAM